MGTSLAAALMREHPKESAAHESGRDNKNPKRSDFICSSSTEELEHLRSVLSGGVRKVHGKIGS